MKALVRLESGFQSRRQFVTAMAGAAAGFPALGAVAGSASEISQSSPAPTVSSTGMVLDSRDRGRRFILDSDGENFFGGMGPDIAAAVRDAVREVGREVTTIVISANAGKCFWPSNIGARSVSHQELAAAHDRGEDPLRLWLQEIRASGREAFLSLRMNDVHDPTSDWNVPRIRKEHPDFIVGLSEVQAGRSRPMSYCLDYARAAVARHMVELLAELLSFYGDLIDGIILDWMRFPRHLSGDEEQVWSQRGVLTAFTAEVRTLVRKARPLRPILLGARTPSSVDGCRYVGMDLAEWGRKELVDFVVPSPFLTTDWRIQVQEFRGLLGASRIFVYSCFDLGFGTQIHHQESLRGICTALYEDAPDGLYLFNFPCWIERLAVRPYHWLAGLQDPGTAAAKPLLLSVNQARSRKKGVDQPPLIPQTVAPGVPFDLPVRVPAGALPVWRAMVHVNCGGDLQLQVNGHDARICTAIDYGAGARRSEVFAEFVNHYREDSLRSKPADCRQFLVDPGCLFAGVNRFVFSNPGTSECRIELFNLVLW